MPQNDTNHDSLNRSLGQIEGKLDGIQKLLETMALKVDSHESFIQNFKGKLVIITGAIAFTTSLLTLWIRKHFIDD